jgi:hypothetical protein
MAFNLRTGASKLECRVWPEADDVFGAEGVDTVIVGLCRAEEPLSDKGRDERGKDDDGDELGVLRRSDEVVAPAGWVPNAATQRIGQFDVRSAPDSGGDGGAPVSLRVDARPTRRVITIAM